MMIDIPRLFNSGFDALEDDSAWRFGVTLWLKSFHGEPAASLPDDDRWLAKTVGLGRDVASWLAVRDLALRNWVKCEDGRLYHKVVAEMALECWIEKLTQKIISSSGNAKQYGVEFDRPAIEAEIDDALAHLLIVAPTSKMPRKVMKRRGRKPAKDAGTPVAIRPDIRAEPQEEDEGEGDILVAVVAAVGAGEAPTLARVDDWPDGGFAEKLFAVAGPGLADPAKSQTLVLSGGEIVRWMQGGCSWEMDVLPTVKAITAKARGSPISSWKFFEAPILESRNRRLAPLPPPQSVDPSDERTRYTTAKHDRLAQGIRSRLSAAMEPLER